MLKHNVALIKIGCGVHTTCTFNAKPGKVLRKIMGFNKKKKYYSAQETPVLPSTSNTFGKSSIAAKITGNPRRSKMLNKVFMRHITDIMATGEYSRDILGLGIEVNQVKVSNDFNYLRVYWIAKESERQEEIEKLLIKSAGYLRHELSTLRVIGQIPNLVFVKDKNYSKISEVQERLKRADFGEDYEQPDVSDQFKSELEILTSLDSSFKAKLETLDQESIDDDDLEEIPLMPHNVLGLNHADILKRVTKGMSKSKAPHRNLDSVEWSQWSEFKTTQPTNIDPLIYANHKEQRNAFKAFLHQRQIMKTKQRRLMNKNWSADRDYLEEELMERHRRNLQFDEEIDEEDFIIEDPDIEIQIK